MKEAWDRTKVPIIGVLAIFIVTVFVFAAINPNALTVEKPRWTITGNVVADNAFFDDTITEESPCAPIDEPVCAKDGKTYRNLCEVRKAGSDLQHLGSCEGGWELIDAEEESQLP